jgi:Icc-related predicted phosphoesterase
LSNKDSDFLAESIRKNKNKKLIVLTHFPPTQEGTINPSTTLYEDFGNLLDRVDLRNVPLWISGHTHWSYNIELPSTRLVSNQLGFVSEKTGYSKNGLFVIDY